MLTNIICIAIVTNTTTITAIFRQILYFIIMSPKRVFSIEIFLLFFMQVGKIGNIVDDSVPISKDEDNDNIVVRKWGNCRDPKGLLNHHDLLWRIGG